MLKRFIRRRRLKRAGPPDHPAPFIVGVGRSGTTLLRMMLDAHPQLAIPPETHFVPRLIGAAEAWRVTPERLLDAAINDPHRRWGDFGISEEEYLERLREIPTVNQADPVRAFFRLYAEKAGKPRWGDKTPGYLTRMRRIKRTLPEARFVHVIRDGRDVALSWNRRLGQREGKDPIPVERLAQRWQRQISGAREDADAIGDYLEIRYEQLVLDTEPTLRRVCEFIALEWDPAMLEYHERAPERLQEMARDMPAADGRPARPGEERLRAHALTAEPPKRERVHAWREQMPHSDREAFERVAGDLLAELGYETRAAPNVSGAGLASSAPPSRG
jgi:hypothetical protein